MINSAYTVNFDPVTEFEVNYEIPEHKKQIKIIFLTRKESS